MLKQAIAAILLLCASCPSHATLIDRETFTTDTATGLDWLDLSETNGLAYTYVVTQFDSGGLWQGWRHATGSEVIGLLTTIGFGPGETYGDLASEPASFTAAFDLYTGLFGDIFGEYQSDYSGALGMVGDSFGPYSGHFALGAVKTNTFYQSANGLLNLNNPLVGRIYEGHFLVRETSSVPEPGTLALLGLGLAGLGVSQRRKA